MALALLTRMSMPPKRATACATAAAHLLLVADVHWSGSALPPAASISCGGGVDGPGQLGVRFGGLGGDDDVGAVAGGAQGDGHADAAAGAGDEQRPALESGAAQAPLDRPKTLFGSLAYLFRDTLDRACAGYNAGL